MGRIQIDITKDKKDGNVETKQFHTSGYILIRLEGESFKFDGDIDLSAFGPMIGKLIMEKMTNSGV